MVSLHKLQLMLIISHFHHKYSVLGYLSSKIINSINYNKNNNIRNYSKFQVSLNDNKNQNQVDNNINDKELFINDNTKTSTTTKLFRLDDNNNDLQINIQPKVINTEKVNNRKEPKGIYFNEDFRDVVEKSSIVIDKSLFIKEIIESDDVITLITMPSRWGKTLNFDMLNRFLSIQYDRKTKTIIPNTQTDNYKLFTGGKIDLHYSRSGKKKKTLKKLKIAKNKNIMLNYQGQFPVIYLTFTSCYHRKSIIEIESKLKEIIISLLKQYCYLNKSEVCSNDITNATVIVKDKYKELLANVDKDYKTTIRDLSHLLHIHHSKKVWILIDEYDTVANESYQIFEDDEAQNVTKLFQNIFETTLKDNKSLAKGVLTGVHCLVKSGLLSGFDNLGKYSMKDNKYSQYYGVNQEEMEILQSHFNLNDNQKEILSKYIGFHEKINIHSSHNDDNEVVEYRMKYNIHSIVKYLNNHLDRYRPYWIESEKIEIFRKVIANNVDIRNEIDSMVQGNSINNFDLIIDFSINDFKILKNMIKHGEILEINRKQYVDVLFSYLYTLGYITHIGNEEYKLPNIEIKEFMQDCITYF